MTIFLIACWAIVFIALTLAVIFMSATAWFNEQYSLYWTNFAAAKERENHEPWYVRFTKWTNSLGGRR